MKKVLLFLLGLMICTGAMGAPAIHLAGDSIIREYTGPDYPRFGWGQFFRELTKPGVRVNNRGLGGRSLKRFITDKNWESLIKDVKKGDFVIISFAHNDQYRTHRGEPLPAKWVAEPAEYAAILKNCISEVRAKGATPVLVTSVPRYRFEKDNVPQQSLGEYPDTMRQVAKDENADLIDLNAEMTEQLRTMDMKESAEFYILDRLNPPHRDTEHLTEKGSRHVAETVAAIARKNNLSIAEWLLPEGTFRAIYPVLGRNCNRVRYEDKLLEAQTTGKDAEIVMIGDSITREWARSGKSAFDKFFKNYRVLNLGFGGDKTQHVLWIAQNKEIWSSLDPKLVILKAGTNNFGGRESSPSSTFEGIKAIVEAVKVSAPNAKILVFGIFPRGQNHTDPFRPYINAVNKRLGELAEPGRVFVENIGDQFLYQDGTISREIMKDYLHLTPAGYNIWFNAIYPYLRKIFPDRASKNYFEVKKDRGAPRIFLNGKVFPARIFFGSVAHGHFLPHAKDAVSREFGYASDIGGLSIFEGHGSLLWSDEDQEKLKAFNKERADRFFKANPHAYLLVRIITTPAISWYNKHPEVKTLFNNGKNGKFAHAIQPSLASEYYQKEVAEALRRTIRFYEETYPGRMAGYHIAGLHTSEWVYDSSYLRETEGYDPCTREGFRKYVAEKYKTDAALQKAWNDKNITLKTVDVPTHEERKGDGVNFLKEPATSQKLIDFGVYRNELVSDTICRLARIVREEQPGRLVGFFYGYVCVASWYGGGDKTGYLSFRKVVDSPDVDFFCTPLHYNGRRRHQSVFTQGFNETVSAAGKIWLNEDDTATYLGYVTADGGPSMMSACRTPQETADMLRRNLIFSLINNHAIWWMDLNGAGWFDDPGMWKTMRELIPFEKALQKNPLPHEPELALSFDQKGAMYFMGEHAKEGAPPNFASDHIISLGFSGAPVGVYLQSDILAGRSKAKVTAFFTNYAMNAKDRAAMRSYAAKNSCIWTWAPGYIDLETGKASLKAVEETTGFKVQKMPDGVTLEVSVTAEGKKLGLPQKMGPALRYGVPEIVQAKPILSPVPRKGDKVLGVYNNGKPAIVLRRVNGKAHVFCGTTVIPPALFRHVGELAKVHFYAPINTPVYSNGREIAVYANKDLNIDVTPRVSRKYTDYYTGKQYSGKKFNVKLKTGETLLLSPLGVTVSEK